MNLATEETTEAAPLADRCRRLAVELGLGTAAEVTEVRPLTGGVASDIAHVVARNRAYCMKFALSKLRVAADWYAPVHRSRAEYAWLEVAAAVAPESAVALFGRSEPLHGFAMEFLDGPDLALWKTDLLIGRVRRGNGRRAGELVGRLHAASTVPGFDRSSFDNREDFRALRIEPYLTAMIGAWPDLAPQLNALADSLFTADRVLVHGDVSPKNIFFRGDAPIILDAECATMGDPCFDLAFCINHLLLKAIHMPSFASVLVAEAGDVWDAYRAHVTWEAPATLEARLARLLPALMLARVDGKSPVEYLDETERQTVRDLAAPLIRQPAERLDDVFSHVGGGAR